jgi:hypothetical protein
MTAMLLIAGCTSSNSPSAAASQSAADAFVSPSPAASPSVTPIPGCLPACVTGQLIVPGGLPAGEYTTQNFFGGQMTVTLPEGWTSFEDSTGEFALQPPDSGESALIFWVDVYPIVDDGTGTRLEGVEPTADGILAWVEGNPNVEVIERSDATLGGLTAQALDIGRSAEAVNTDPDCPPDVSPCVGLFSYPEWNGGFFSNGGPFHSRLIVADATWGGSEHVIYAIVNAGDEEAFESFAPAAMEIIEGARLPPGVGQ